MAVFKQYVSQGGLYKKKLFKHGRVWYGRDRGCLVNPTVASFFQYYHSIKKLKIIVTTH